MDTATGWVEWVGWLAAWAFALSGAPFAWRAVKDPSVTIGTPWSGVLAILFGAAGMLVYEWFTARSWPQLFDFSFVLLCWGVVAWVKCDQDCRHQRFLVSVDEYVDSLKDDPLFKPKRKRKGAAKGKGKGRGDRKHGG